MKRCVLALQSFGLLFASVALLEASDSPLSQLVVNLFRPQNYVNAVGVGPNHTAHFQLSGGTAGTEILFLNAALVNQAIITQLTSVPLGSSSGGFTYSFNPEVGTFDRSSNSFGPSLAERALTNGRGKFNFGISYQSSSFDSFEGKNLQNGDLKFYLLHNDCCAPPGNGILTTPAFEGDIIESSLSMTLKTQSVLFFFNYGITDRFDVSLVVPISNVDVQATNTARLDRLSTESNHGIHFFNSGDPDTVAFSDSGSASGIGDIAVRAKWNFYRVQGGGLAAAFEVRAPTGDEKNLLGLGTTQAKVSFIASTAWGRLAPHFNLGYKFSGNPPDSLSQLTFPELVGVDAPTNPSVTRETPQTLSLNQVDIAPDEFNYAAGFDIVAASRVTLAADLIGRRLIDAGRLREFPFEHRYRAEGPDGNVLVDDGPVRSITFQQLFLDPVSVNQIFAAVGAKVNIGSTFLLSANVLFSLTQEGLRDKVVPIFGFDYVF
jgi:Putative MetA-pathway of phenol degradation